MYKFFIRPVLFLFDPELIHHFTFGVLGLIGKIPGVRSLIKSVHVIQDKKLERNLLGLTFRNPIGLAAGFDKNAKRIDDLSCLGFGFIEIGTVTPKPQAGNDKPRLFRLPKDRAIINRMGFNNDGARAVAERLKQRKSQLIIGGNIGKNKSTPNEEAFNDYSSCINELDPYVDYFVVNVSSPNTPGLRELQGKQPLKNLLEGVRILTQSKLQPKPVLLKIAPDLTVEQLDDIIDILIETKTDGVIATNTTISREHLTTKKTKVDQMGAGGVSGKPLTNHSTEVIRYLRKQLGPSYPIIGVGGIMSPKDAIDKLKAGASLVQVYTGFIYEGPSFVKKICKKILQESSSASM